MKKNSMILLFHPDIPGGETKGKKHIGYWDDSDWPGDQKWNLFYQARGMVLPRPEDFVDVSWGADERAAVIEYLQAGKEEIAWRGYSYCRMGCKHPKGPSGTCCLTDGEWVWPSGFAHYVEKHNVKPPEEFIRKVLLS